MVGLLLKLLSAEATKTLIGLAINKLLEHKEDGITKDIAKIMIDGIAKSKMNPTTKDVFKDAIEVLK